MTPYGIKKTEPINVGVSNRHVHLSKRDKEFLFGADYEFTYIRALSQKGQFAAKETVTLVGPKGSIDNVRILGPEREHTQVEVSRTDLFRLGADAPVRDSGDIEGSTGIVIIGPRGIASIKKGLICAKRHIHMTARDARYYGLKDGAEVSVITRGERSLIFEKTLVRVDESFALEFHVDTDEANAAGLTNDDKVEIIYSL